MGWGAEAGRRREEGDEMVGEDKKWGCKKVVRLLIYSRQRRAYDAIVRLRRFCEELLLRRTKSRLVIFWQISQYSFKKISNPPSFILIRPQFGSIPRFTSDFLASSGLS
jgi:hypothetical protein